MRESAGVTAAGSSCDRGVDVAPAGRGGDVEGAVAVVPDRSQPRLPAGGGLVSLGSKRLVTKLIAGWIVLPAL